MAFTKKQEEYKIEKEGQDEVLKLNYEEKPYSPSIEGNPLVMMDAIDRLIENPAITRISFFQRRNYNYDYPQTTMLMDIANIISHFVA